jgi:hypothetical protein
VREHGTRGRGHGEAMERPLIINAETLPADKLNRAINRIRQGLATAHALHIDVAFSCILKQRWDGRNSFV